MEKLNMQAKAGQKKNNTEEAENFLEPELLYNFYIARLDIVQIHFLCRNCVTWL